MAATSWALREPFPGTWGAHAEFVERVPLAHQQLPRAPRCTDSQGFLRVSAAWEVGSPPKMRLGLLRQMLPLEWQVLRLEWQAPHFGELHKGCDMLHGARAKLHG